MKTITVDKPVRDVDGVFRALKNADPPFVALSVGADQKKTYVYLDEGEEKDPTEIVLGWQDAPEIRVKSTAPLGSLGIPEVQADGLEVHDLLIRKTTPSGEVVPGDERVLISTPHMVNISMLRPRLNEGMATVQIGPSKIHGEALVEVSDPDGVMKSSKLIVRFLLPKAKPPEPVPEPGQEPAGEKVEKKGGIMAVFRRILGI
jgi:hypothetical protein